MVVCTTKVPKSKHIPFARVEYLSCQIAVQRHRMMRRHPKLGSVDVGWVGGASHCFSHIPGTQNRILRLEARPRARGVFVVIPEPHRMLLCFVCDVPCCVLIFFPKHNEHHSDVSTLWHVCGLCTFATLIIQFTHLNITHTRSNIPAVSLDQMSRQQQAAAGKTPTSDDLRAVTFDW